MRNLTGTQGDMFVITFFLHSAPNLIYQFCVNIYYHTHVLNLAFPSFSEQDISHVTYEPSKRPCPP